jgi:hypothetical protein
VPRAGAEGRDDYRGLKRHLWAGGAGHPDTRRRAEYLRRLSAFLEERLAEATAG